MSFTTIGEMVTSMLLLRLQVFFKKYLMMAAILAMGIAFGVLIVTHSIPIILMSVCVVGFGQGIIFPLINVKVFGNIDPRLSYRVISIVSSIIYIGQFLSPVVLDFIGKAAGCESIRFQYSLLGRCSFQLL